ncbi:MAG: hypothetical protein B7Y25_00260 [Alphaproteobacteria bacterium 16-39-46]|nr:MAG: hypothetical protein B7Y25_00260 [Alphaproteobacteria bacterium 16-39-46]OZA44510.1 MAG: hypothetical protein B7X84_00060 [Alphaproteobacteria bacterium 17-39-52]HQS83357.1 class I SAM-dependent methyltransferase [Alphaproteobacteria bacterium]HQS93044.1 class I SAM-dependent methyltransferase [Alphaproteobacteria bacterium]
MHKSPEFVVNIIKNFWIPGQKILEIGCGPAFLRKVFGKDYIGTDITDRPYSKDLLRDVDLVCPSDKLFLKDNSIDVVVVKSALYLFPNHESTLKEILRVLKLNGKLLIFDYNRRTQKELMRKEGHTNYPCWTQWGLKKLIKINGFKNVALLLAEDKQPCGFERCYKLLRNEYYGTWAIVCGTK